MQEFQQSIDARMRRTYARNDARMRRARLLAQAKSPRTGLLMVIAAAVLLSAILANLGWLPR